MYIEDTEKYSVQVSKSFVDNMNQELIEALRIDTDDTERERLYLKRLLHTHRPDFILAYMVFVCLFCP